MAMMNSSVGDLWLATVWVHLRIRVATERQDEFRSFLREAISFYEAPGGIRVHLLSQDTEPERFIEQIEYVDERAYQNDDERTRSDPTMAQLLARWRSLLAEPPTVEVYRESPLSP
jgi:quinol monooxygenase YgiN